MKVSELMVDNFVRLNKEIDDFKKEIVVVRTIFSFNEASVGDLEGFRYCSIKAHYLDPIPLTVDVLKAYGFEKTSSLVPRYILDDDLYTVFAKKINDSAWLIDVLDNNFNLPDQSAIVCHVHQLQQWLRFCGIEREVKMSSLTSINTI